MTDTQAIDVDELIGKLEYKVFGYQRANPQGPEAAALIRTLQTQLADAQKRIGELEEQLQHELLLNGANAL